MTDRAEEAVLAANTAFYNAFEAGDIDLMAAIWLPEPDPVCIHPGNVAIGGYAGVMRAWAMIFANTPYIQFFLTDVVVRVDREVAYVTCTENVLSAGDGAPEEGFAGGKALATNVFRHTTTGWRLWIHHASPVMSSGGHEEEAGWAARHCLPT
jgi:ketosteroid isomerase-like protein